MVPCMYDTSMYVVESTTRKCLAAKSFKSCREEINHNKRFSLDWQEETNDNTMSNQPILPYRKSLSFYEINEIEHLEDRVEELVEFIDKTNTILCEIIVNKILNVNDAVKTRICTAILYNPRITSIKITSVKIDKQLALWIARFRRMESLTRLEFKGLDKLWFASEFVFDTPDETYARNIAYMLQTNTRLQELSFISLHRDTSKLFLRALAHFSRPRASLRKLTIRQCLLSHDCFVHVGRALENFTALDTLVVRDVGYVGIEDASMLSEGIEKSASIRAVDFCINQHSEAAERILSALSTKSGLKNLSFGSVHSNEDKCSLALARIIDANPSIEDFSVVRGSSWQYNEYDFCTPENPVTYSGIRYARASRAAQRSSDSMNVTALGAAVAANRSLKAFTLHDFAIDVIGVRSLCDSLSRNEILESLTFHGQSSIDEEGMHLICTLISHSSSLKSLNLKGPKLDTSTINLLCEAMEGNARIEVLCVHSSCMNDEDVVRMGEMLLRNTTLKTLRLERHRPRTVRCLMRHKKLSDTSLRVLIEGVKVHRSITNVEVFSNGIFREGSVLLQQELDYCVELNKGPRRLLREDAALPMGLWPLALNRANTYSRGNHSPPSVLYFLVKEKADLFANVDRRV